MSRKREIRLMDRLKQPQNRGYFIASIGALVALLAILLLPFATITLSSSTTNGPSEYVAITMNTTALSGSLNQTTFSFFHLPLNQGMLWLLPILALVALVLIGLVLFRSLPFGKGINAPAENQRRWGNYALIAVASLGVLIEILVFSGLNSQIQTAISSAGSSTNPTTVSTGPHIGFWLYLLGMAAVAGGIILLLAQANKQTQAVPPYTHWSPPSNSYYPPYTTGSQQAWPQPSQPAQSPPYSPQQWPPASNPQQPPYPPTGQ
jgi:hypothetical protein